jgi:hypothetical protein
MEMSGQLHAPATSPPGEEPAVSIGQEAGRAPEPVWTHRRRETYLLLPGIEHGHPACILVTRVVTVARRCLYGDVC